MHKQANFKLPEYRRDIDGLRAIAVSSVIIYHSFPGHLSGGFVGVDIFFVISGFLISTIIFQNLENNSFSFLEFYTRRIRRIFPALILLLGSCLAFGWFNLFADEYQQLGKHIAASAGFVQNFILWGEAGYFDNSAETKPLLHLWSLAIEEQFYIIFPFLLWTAWKFRFNFLTVIIIIFSISLYLNLVSVEKDPTATFYLPQTRFWELLSGGILGWYNFYKRNQISPFIFNHKLISSFFRKSFGSSDSFASSISLFGFSLIIWSVTQIEETWIFPGYWAIVPVFGAALVIVAGQKAWVNHYILSKRFFVGIGLISYPLYLWHWPLLSFARIIERKIPHHDVRLTMVGISIFLATLTYFLIEQPIRSAKQTKVKFFILVMLAFIVGYAGLNIYQRDGLKFRSKEKTDAAASFEWRSTNIVTQKCIFGIAPYQSEYCVSSTNYPVNIALIGDSHANSLFPFFKSYFEKRGLGVIQLGKSGCPPFLDVERDASLCPEFMDSIVSFLEFNNEIKRVFLTGRFAATYTGVNFGRHEKNWSYLIKDITDSSLKDRKIIFQQGLSRIIERLHRANKDVAVILDVPELNFDPKKCVDIPSVNECAIKKSIVLERQSGYRNLISDLSKKYNFKIIDLLELFCPDNFCYAKSGNDILYRDSHHLGVFAAQFLLRNEVKLNLVSD